MVSPVRGHGSIYPESGGGHEDVEGPTSPTHEAAFHQWNDTLTQNYNAAHPGTQNAEASLSRYPLYRAAQQNPNDVFRPGGRLETSTTLGNRTKPDPSFLLSRHQTGLPSHYTSMTTSLPATQELSKAFRRDHVYVTDPQPHGRYLNGLAYSPETAPRPGTGNALADAVRYPVTDEAFRQHEVSVPGSIPTESIRGSVPVDQATGNLDFSELKKNRYYKSPADHQREAGGGQAASSVGLSSEGSSDSLSQQVLRDSGLSDPLRRL